MMKDFKDFLGLENTFDTSLFSCTSDKHPLKKIKMHEMHEMQNIINDNFFQDRVALTFRTVSRLLYLRYQYDTLLKNINSNPIH